MGIKGDVIQASSFPRNNLKYIFFFQPGHLGLLHSHLLTTNRVVLVNVQVEDVNLAVHGHRCKHCAGVGSPSNIPNLRIQVEHEKGLSKMITLSDFKNQISFIFHDLFSYVEL